MRLPQAKMSARTLISVLAVVFAAHVAAEGPDASASTFGWGGGGHGGFRPTPTIQFTCQPFPVLTGPSE
jgi:hypothetical protein